MREIFAMPIAVSFDPQSAVPPPGVARLASWVMLWLAFLAAAAILGGAAAMKRVFGPAAPPTVAR
jgi:hypothetical protein